MQAQALNSTSRVPSSRRSAFPDRLPTILRGFKDLLRRPFPGRVTAAFLSSWKDCICGEYLGPGI